MIIKEEAPGFNLRKERKYPHAYDRNEIFRNSCRTYYEIVGILDEAEVCVPTACKEDTTTTLKAPHETNLGA